MTPADIRKRADWLPYSADADIYHLLRALADVVEAAISVTRCGQCSECVKVCGIALARVVALQP